MKGNKFQDHSKALGWGTGKIHRSLRCPHRIQKLLPGSKSGSVSPWNVAKPKPMGPGSTKHIPRQQTQVQSCPGSVIAWKGEGTRKPENIARGTRSVHSSRCATGLAGRTPPPGHTRCYRAPAMLEETRDLVLSTTHHSNLYTSLAPAPSLWSTQSGAIWHPNFMPI